MLLRCGIVGAESNAALAYYAIQSDKWPCEESLKAFEKVPAIHISFLYNTFGSSFRCLDKLLADPRAKSVEIHLVNEVCLRNNRCGPYEFLSGQSLKSYDDGWKDGTIRRRFREYIKPVTDWVSKLRGDLECTVSGGLESNLSQAGGANLAATVKNLFPRCRVVWNPVRGQPIPSTIFESHGSRPALGQPCIANLDGEDINFPERRSASPNKLNSSEIPAYLGRYAKCETANIWISEFNGICQSGPWKDPRERSCFPTRQLFTAVNKLIRAEPTGPVVVPPWDEKARSSEKGCTAIERAQDGEKRDFVWKESDTKKNREGELVAIVLFPRKFKQQFKRVEIFHNGKRIEQMSYVYQYTEDGSNRQVWRSERAPKDYPLNSLIKTDSVCFRLRNPRGRID